MSPPFYALDKEYILNDTRKGKKVRIPTNASGEWK